MSRLALLLAFLPMLVYPSTLLMDKVAVQSCGAVWTTDGKWIACVIKRDGFDGK